MVAVEGDERMGEAERGGVVLDRSPSHLLHRALQHALDIYVEEAGADGPTQRQFAVLRAVADDEGLTQTELVRATGIDRSTLADMVARMIAKGLLERERSATDARANAVRLTDAGRESMTGAEPKVVSADSRILDLAPPNSRERFLKILLAMSRAAEGQTAAAKDDDGKAKRGKKKKAKKKARKAAKKAAKAAVVAVEPEPEAA